MRNTSQGSCNLCGSKVTKAAMTKHLRACRDKKPGASGERAKCLHIVVEGNGLPQYWLHLDAPASSTLADLDRFLRDIWLECCGHLSVFTIGGVLYDSHPCGEFGPPNKSMNVKLYGVLRPGAVFGHEYDFGTTTELKGRVVAEHERPVRAKESIRLLARNDPPDIPCDSCKTNSSVVICTECLWGGDESWFCDACAKKHECGEEMFLPVVNSPRVGMCGYVG